LLRKRQEYLPWKNELSKVEFEIIDKALKALLQSNLDPVTADKATDLRNMFQDAYTDWLEIYQEACPQGQIGDEPKEYYRACTTGELPPQLLTLSKKLGEELLKKQEQ
jgi:hypothetical protein